MRSRRKLEIIAGRVNTDGSVAAGDGFTVNKPGTGNYQITLQSGFRLIVVTAVAYVASSVAVNTSLIGERSFTVGPYATTTGTAQDSAFQFIAAGVQQ